MIWEFGQNCAYYLPTLGKCRMLIDNYRTRKDLVDRVWLDTKDVMVYLDLSAATLLKGVTSGEIKTKRQNDGKLSFGVLVAAHYDDCYNAASGGRCLFYKEHNGRKILYLDELKHIEIDHPNNKNIPSVADIRAAEDSINQIPVTLTPVV